MIPASVVVASMLRRNPFIVQIIMKQEHATVNTPSII